MKKLMIAAVTAAVAGGAFAAMPAVYSYKATVKHMYLKEVNVSVNTGVVVQKFKIYQKYHKSATLNGYLVHDVLGATSYATYAGFTQPLVAAPVVARNPVGPWYDIDGVPANGLVAGQPPVADVVNNRAFLIVQNTSAEAAVKQPKILPAIFDAKFFDTKYKTTFDWITGVEPDYTSGIAEANLFVGGDLGPGVKEFLRNDRIDSNVLSRNPSIASFDPITAAPAGTADGLTIRALGSYLDYGWTSIYLFGRYNGANGNGGQEWNNVENAIAGVQIIPGRVGLTRPFFHDTWMNGTGVGKYGVVDDSEDCCNFSIGGVNFGLDTLAGKLKGGLFLCTHNGYTVKGYQKLAGIDWEDQFWNEKAFLAYAAPAVGQNPTYAAAGDLDQEDVWIDGNIELFTSDVLDGDWSIKRITTANVPTSYLTNDEIRDLSGIGALVGNQSYKPSVAAVFLPDNTDLDDLNATIKGCALALKSNLEFNRNAQTIPTIASQANNNRFTVPFIDRNFARAYGLMGYARGTF